MLFDRIFLYFLHISGKKKFYVEYFWQKIKINCNLNWTKMFLENFCSKEPTRNMQSAFGIEQPRDVNYEFPPSPPHGCYQKIIAIRDGDDIKLLETTHQMCDGGLKGRPHPFVDLFYLIFTYFIGFTICLEIDAKASSPMYSLSRKEWKVNIACTVFTDPAIPDIQ